MAPLRYAHGDPLFRDVRSRNSDVCVDQAKSTGLEMGVIKSRLARPVRARQCNHHGALVERQIHFRRALAFWNWRLTNLPSVRVPSASIRNKSPGPSAAGS